MFWDVGWEHAIPWYHPEAVWYLAARAPDRLLSRDEMAFLKGAVLNDPQLAASKAVPLSKTRGRAPLFRRAVWRFRPPLL